MRHGRVVDDSVGPSVNVRLDGVTVNAYLLNGPLLAGQIATVVQEARRIVAVGVKPAIVVPPEPPYPMFYTGAYDHSYFYSYSLDPALLSPGPWLNEALTTNELPVRAMEVSYCWSNSEPAARTTDLAGTEITVSVEVRGVAGTPPDELTLLAATVGQDDVDDIDLRDDLDETSWLPVEFTYTPDGESGQRLQVLVGSDADAMAPRARVDSGTTVTAVPGTPDMLIRAKEPSTPYNTWASDGFEVGQQIILDWALNDGIWTVTDVDTDVIIDGDDYWCLVLDTDDTLVEETVSGGITEQYIPPLEDYNVWLEFRNLSIELTA